MHPDTAAAIRLLALALRAHPEDLPRLNAYVDLEGFADLIGDYIEDDDSEGA